MHPELQEPPSCTVAILQGVLSREECVAGAVLVWLGDTGTDWVELEAAACCRASVLRIRLSSASKLRSLLSVAR